MTSSRFEQAILAIDEANAADPNSIWFEGKEHNKELLHSELMTKWVANLNPEAEEAQLLAARASHLRRWELARNSYEPGRAGYLKWRKDQAKRHFEDVSQILASVGYEQDIIERVGQIIQKKNLKTDAQVQIHEDALCLVFVSTQLEEFKSKVETTKLDDILKKTLNKMSQKAREIALAMVEGQL